MYKIAAIATTTVLAAGGLAGLTVTADAAPGAVAGQAVRAALHASEAARPVTVQPAARLPSEICCRTRTGRTA